MSWNYPCAFELLTIKKPFMKKWGLLFLSIFWVTLSFHTILFGFKIPNLGFFAWVGLVPLILLLKKANPRQAFLYGWIFASFTIYFSGFWLYTTFHQYGGLPILISAFLPFVVGSMGALYFGAACGLAVFFVRKQKGILLVWLPICWTLFEGLRNYTPAGGFPWFNIAMSQSLYLPLIQFADITGVYGVIFLIVWINVWLAEILLHWRGEKQDRLLPKTVVTLLLLATVLGYGFYRLQNIEKIALTSPRLKVGLIQSNIGQDEKFAQTQIDKEKEFFFKSVDEVQKSVDLIVWPETSWFKDLWLEESKIDPMDIGITLNSKEFPYSLIGLVFHFDQNGKTQYYNSAALIDAAGNIRQKYHKTHLVPFGEYIPWKKLFFFLEPMVAIGNFEAGPSLTPIPFNGTSLGVMICGEDIFPELARELVNKGANLLVNMSNDAWYGFSSEASQHLALATYRSIETRKSTIRATNTGISSVILPTGKTIIQAPLLEESVLIYQVPLLKSEPSVYLLAGDWLIAACFIFLIWHAIKFYVQRNQRKV